MTLARVVLIPYFARIVTYFMKRAGLERKLVVVLFIMVLVTFYFAQADTNKIETMYQHNYPPVTTSLDKTNSVKPTAQQVQQAIVVR